MPKEPEPKPIEGQDLEPAHHHHGHHDDAAKAEKRDQKKEGEPSETPDPQPWPTAPIAMTNPRGPVTHEPLEEESDESKDAKKEMEEL